MDESPTSAPPPADGELLSAYLAGELDDAASAALERRLVQDGALRTALERQRQLQEVFAGLAGAAPPPGAGARLRARLDAERAAPGSVVTDVARSDAPAATPVSLDAARARRRPGRVNWAAVSGVAAALVAVSVVGAGLLRGAGDGADMAAETDTAREFLDEATTSDEGGAPAPADAPDTEELATPEVAQDDAAADDVDVMEGDTDGEETFQSLRAAPAAPSVVDEGAALADEDAAREHLGRHTRPLPFAGTAAEEGREVAASFEIALRGADALADGTRPDACLDEITTGAPGVVIPVAVESVVYQGTPSLAYVLAASADADSPIERAEAWIVEPTACTTRLYLLLDP